MNALSEVCRAHHLEGLGPEMAVPDGGKGFVYALINRETGHIYVGQTNGRMATRLAGHRTSARAGRHISEGLQTDWNLYGEDAFCCELLSRIPIGSNSRILENEWINFLRAAGATLYNYQFHWARPQRKHEERYRVLVPSLRRAQPAGQGDS